MNTPHAAPDYGPRARIGIAVPHSNPTVEPEIRALVPATVGVYATRMFHDAPRVEDRLGHYIRHLPEAIATFGVLKLAAFGFGCTGSSYLAGAAVEERLVAEAEAVAGVPVITAARAIRLALEAHGCRTLALVSPYPADLAEAGYRYWAEAGLRVAGRLRVDPDLTDTHRIYELTSDDALAALRAVDRTGADVIVASGTGMPTLRALGALGAALAGGGPPVLSSNLCLAWALTRVAAPELAPALPGQMLGAP